MGEKVGVPWGFKKRWPRPMRGVWEGLLEKGSASSQFIQLHRKPRDPKRHVN